MTKKTSAHDIVMKPALFAACDLFCFSGNVVIMLVIKMGYLPSASNLAKWSAIVYSQKLLNEIKTWMQEV